MSTTTTSATIVDLFGALHRDGETVAICHQQPGGPFRSALVGAGTPAAVAVAPLARGVHVWHSVNPVRPNVAGRGGEADVTRLAALWADLDVGYKSGALPDLNAAHAVINNLATMLGTRPSFIVSTGGGLHPYWLLDDDEHLVLDDDAKRRAAKALLARWHRLVTRVARAHGAESIDNVCDLARVLRTPGTENPKRQPSVLASVEADDGYPLEVDAVLEALEGHGVDELPGDGDSLGDVVLSRHDWPVTSRACGYVRSIVAGLADDGPAPGSGRHHWALKQLIRVVAGRRTGCIGDDELATAAETLQARLDVLRAQDGRRPGEVRDDLLPWAIDRVARMGDEQLRRELSGHTHAEDRQATADDLDGLIAPEPSSAAVANSELVEAIAAHHGQARLAYRLAQVAGGRLLHVHGIDWHHWDGTRWAVDDRGVAKQTVLEMLRHEWRQAMNDQARAKEVKSANTHNGIQGILSIAAALEPFAATVRDLDADPYLLNVANGTLDLRTLQLRPHDPADRITKVTGAAYDPDARSELWEAFLARVLPDAEVRAFVQRYAGLGLLGKVVEHMLAIFTGTGRNGKGVFYGALADALGDYAGTAEPDLFMQRDRAHPAGEMDLLGARWVVISESDEGRKIAAATMKRLTGGDRIKARALYRDFVEFEPSHTPVLVTNHLPKVRGDDPAIWARLRVVPFDVTIPDDEQDKRLGEKLAVERDAVLAWAVAGWASYQQRGGLAEPAAVKAATDQYHLDSDAVGRFIADECIEGPNFWVASGDLWTRWVEWCTADGIDPGSNKALGTALERRDFPAGKGARGLRIRRGIGLVEQDDEEP